MQARAIVIIIAIDETVVIDPYQSKPSNYLLFYSRQVKPCAALIAVLITGPSMRYKKPVAVCIS